MTKPVRSSRILKDANGVDINDHLRNHIHLTNCIHLKNHIHKQSPILADRSLMRDLIVLQRSRSLKDPSASPPSWQHSTSVVDLLPKKGVEDEHVQEGGRSVRNDIDPSSSRRLSGGSLQFSSHPLSKVVPDEEDHDVNGLLVDTNSGNSGSKDRKGRRKLKHSEDVHMDVLTQQMKEVAVDSDVASSSNIHRSGKTEPRSRGYGGGSRVKRRKGARRGRVSASRDVAGQKEVSVGSNSLARSSMRPRHHMNDEEEEEEEYGDQDMAQDPRNGCGIPWNWSRIHDRSRTILDKAGRSLSCGLSESRSRRGRDIDDMPMVSGQSSSESRSDAQVLPLLVDTSDNAGWVHDYSGELGFYADSLLRNDLDLAKKDQNHNCSRHQNLTQKYMPRSFRDLVGQNLVCQALSNAVTRRKVGLLYVFYGPHGTGKTSSARIFARALNCQSMEPPKPCGTCNSCTAHENGKNRYIREVGPVSNFDFKSVMNLLHSAIVSHHYRVFIFDDCDSLSPDCWSAISKVVDRAPRRVVFILVSSSLDVLPHMIISRCQKFFFPKLKDADIIYTLQWISSREDIDIDKEALKLIASRSDGSLRDAEMTLEQLSLLGQQISVSLVQELVGLISDEKLVDLLDMALSADTVNTVKSLRVIMEAGVEPLALMSQLATVITDILAGTYDFTREKHRRKFFRQQPMSKEEMEKLRQALKTLSEAEKQLRTSNDKLTWLTAALLQLAPDQQYLLPTSSAAPSFGNSPLTRTVEQRGEMADNERRSSQHVRTKNGTDMDRKRNSVSSGVPSKTISDKNRIGYHEIWLEVIEKIQIKTIREFLYHEGTLVSISFGTEPTVQLMFSSQLTKSKAEKFMTYILRAFESVLGSPVMIEIRSETNSKGRHRPFALPASKNGSLQVARDRDSRPEESRDAGRDEIVEVPAHERRSSSATGTRNGELNQCRSLVKGKVSLAHVIQQVEGFTQPDRWSRRKALTIAEKIERENLRMEARSRSMLCWKASRATHRKLSRLKTRKRRSRSLLKLISCGKCISSKPRSPT
ncbi:Protein STICHEL-like 3 [Linum perenne]